MYVVTSNNFDVGRVNAFCKNLNQVCSNVHYLQVHHLVALALTNVPHASGVNLSHVIATNGVNVNMIRINYILQCYSCESTWMKQYMKRR